MMANEMKNAAQKHDREMLESQKIHDRKIVTEVAKKHRKVTSKSKNSKRKKTNDTPLDTPANPYLEYRAKNIEKNNKRLKELGLSKSPPSTAGKEISSPRIKISLKKRKPKENSSQGVTVTKRRTLQYNEESAGETQDDETNH